MTYTLTPLLQFGNTSMNETWKDAIGYEGRYRVSDLGNVETHVARDGKVRLLSPVKKKTGYIYVTLRNESHVGKQWRLNVLVATNFLGPKPSSGHQACHKNGDKSNNASLNLRWGTPKSNSDDKNDHGTMLRGERVANSKLSDLNVAAIKRRLSDGERGIDIAKDYGVSKHTVSLINTGKSWLSVRCANV